MTLLPHAGSKRTELQFLKQQIHQLEETITTQSLKAFAVCALELYLSFALVLSLFECPDPAKRDEQELQYMTRMAWIPMLWGLLLSFGHKLVPSIAPAPENLDRNLRNSKLATWILSLLLLVWDDDMQLKQGPALQVAVMFSVCDLARYQMEIAQLIEDDEEDDDLRTDQEVESLVEAVDAARQANAEEEAFKNQLQAVVGHHDSDSDGEDDREVKATLHHRLSSAEDNGYQQYEPTPSALTTQHGDRRLVG